MKIVNFLTVVAVLAVFFVSGCSSTSVSEDEVPDAPIGDTGTASDVVGGDTVSDAVADTETDTQPGPPVRVATFNTSLFRTEAGGLVADLESGEDAQARQIAEVIQTIRPDVILLNEFDYDAEGRSLDAFRSQYLEVSQNGKDAIEYEFGWVFSSNTGVHSGFDLDNDGGVTSEPGSRQYGGDAFGYGVFEGQYGFAVLSRFPESSAPRTFQNFLWKDMPNSRIPADWYDANERDLFRLSSKNHVDLALDVQGQEIHILASHPTPPGFDGAEDRNGKRNADEVQFWLDYIGESSYFVDDLGGEGGLAAGAHFVIVGDLNVDPVDGDAISDPMVGILSHGRVASLEPKSTGAPEAASEQGRANARQSGDPALDTADFSDSVVGNLRVDYALASKSLNPIDTGVFWPARGEDDAELAGASDHHMVWVDVQP